MVEIPALLSMTPPTRSLEFWCGEHATLIQITLTTAVTRMCAVPLEYLAVRAKVCQGLYNSSPIFLHLNWSQVKSKQLQGRENNYQRSSPGGVFGNSACPELKPS